MASSNIILNPPKRLTQEYFIKPFDCGNPDLNSFLFNDAKYNLRYLLSVTYLIENEDKTIAYFNVANDLLRINVDSNREFKNILRKRVKDEHHFIYKLFEYRAFPAVKIGRLAVDSNFQCKGIGSQLINAITYSFINNNKTGCVFITVEAINDEKTIHFYRKNGFDFLHPTDANESSRVMYRCLLNYAEWLL
jgi:ribosomal protein S18 acetylase RimI-like enzyme